jgi:hypothetical protein
MARTTAFAAVVVASLTVATSAAGGTSLVAISRPSRSSAKLTYSSSDGIAGLVKGGGTSASAISVDLFVRQGGTTATFVIPTGTYGERAGWLRNDAARAQFVNRDAPAGPTSLSRTTFSVGRRVKATAKSLGDENPLALGAAPAGDLAIAYVVTNGAERLAHCTKFLPGRCTFTPLDGGTGWRLRCRDGVADPDCAARPVCGNGVHERGEWCDGGPACDQTCTHPLTGCCDYQGQCIAAPYFSLYGYFVQYCGSLLNTAAHIGPGFMCDAGGVCADVTIDPMPMCCQVTDDTCMGTIETSLGGLWSARHNCIGIAGFDFTRTHYNATCTVGGTCTPR